jgi:hypothetical protein
MRDPSQGSTLHHIMPDRGRSERGCERAPRRGRGRGRGRGRSRSAKDSSVAGTRRDNVALWHSKQAAQRRLHPTPTRCASAVDAPDSDTAGKLVLPIGKQAITGLDRWGRVGASGRPKHPNPIPAR